MLKNFKDTFVYFTTPENKRVAIKPWAIAAICEAEYGGSKIAIGDISYSVTESYEEVMSSLQEYEEKDLASYTAASTG